MRIAFSIILCLGMGAVQAQINIKGKIVDKESQPIAAATIVLEELQKSTFTNEKGEFVFENLPNQNYHLIAFAYSYSQVRLPLGTNHNQALKIILEPLEKNLDPVTIQASREKTFGIRRLSAVENFGIYEAKKTEVIELQDITANFATNNPRQIYAKIAGVNIWESDMAGLQLGIGTRGLSPKRTGNFNTRQNGYDISADALGYPESYYTPPVEALERIEIVRGAASLQYGTQFGGLLNFVFKKGAEDRKIAVNTRQTGGSWGFFNSFNSVGGTLANGKLNYYTFYQYKRGDGWRPNSQFTNHTAFAGLHYQASEKLSINAEYTYMNYLAKQPGGLTDVEFETDPSVSRRARNWFQVDWNLLAVNATYQFTERTSLNVRNFALFSGRQSLGNLERISRQDNPTQNRTLIKDTYQNFGNETRLLHRYNFGKQQNNILLGVRYYQGYTIKQQGDADNTANANFNFLNPENLESSDYVFPSRNIAVFAENIFNITNKWSITPGVRYEFIDTESDGYFLNTVRDRAGNIVVNQRNDEQTNVERSFVLLGLGVSYKPTENIEFYSNFAQNYRPITFSDLRIDNPNFRLDSAITDEKGYNIDVGIRGNKSLWFNFDVSAFYMRYDNRIGFTTAFDERLLNEYRFKTNTGNSTHLGLETFAEVDILKLLIPESKVGLSVFSNLTLVKATYTESENALIEGNKVELAPELLWRGGLTFTKGNFRTTCQYAYVSEQFTDAENTQSQRVPNAIIGLIPAYSVMDWSVAYKYKFLVFETGMNNVLNTSYFTRRADSYPGPGIIPADPRSFYITLGANF